MQKTEKKLFKGPMPRYSKFFFQYSPALLIASKPYSTHSSEHLSKSRHESGERRETLLRQGRIYLVALRRWLSDSISTKFLEGLCTE